MRYASEEPYCIVNRLHRCRLFTFINLIELVGLHEAVRGNRRLAIGRSGVAD